MAGQDETQASAALAEAIKARLAAEGESDLAPVARAVLLDYLRNPANSGFSTLQEALNLVESVAPQFADAVEASTRALAKGGPGTWEHLVRLYRKS